ncbi:MAG TPA: HAMP domain-containing sensor histidine kinase [Longimicrobiaceae bacterium]|nr:HAMP domain-containing sensor histidine kinase [Longimicrobiaceae bacterium]
MIELQLFLNGDEDEANRLRALLAREGFRVQEPAPGRTGGRAIIASAFDAEDDAAMSEATARRIEELELSLRELRNLDVAKSQFLANVSHELRTPLTAIVTYGEVLRDGLLGKVNERQREAIQSVITSSRQLLTMIEEILTYARTNARAIELEASEFDVSEVASDVHQMSASLIRKKRLNFETRISPDLPRVHADRDKVLHVLGNLIGNAIDFTPAEGFIRVEARRHRRDPSWVEVVVSDTGIGIDPAHHEMIFREFAQVDSSRSRRHHGTGLGLAIARNFIQLHGGEIWVESELGRGSRFVFTIPSVEARTSPGAT